MCVRAKLFQSCLTFCDPMDCSPPAFLSMGFSRQEYRSGLPFPTQGDLPSPGIEPASRVAPALAGGFLTTSTTGEDHTIQQLHCKVYTLKKNSQDPFLLYTDY